MFSVFMNKGENRSNKSTAQSEAVERRASHISADTPKKRTPVCAGFVCASGDSDGQLGGVMCRFRYKGSEKMRTERYVGLAADAVLFARNLQ